MGIPLAKAELIGTFIETLGYGAYLVVLLECLQVLYLKHVSGRPMIYLFVLAMAIFGLVTAHLVVDIDRVMHAFTDDPKTPNAAGTYYAHINTHLNLAKSATYIAVTLISDALIVYRTFVIWGRNFWIVIVPSLLFLADIATSAWACYSITEVRFGDNVMAANVTLRVKYFYSITLALQWCCTLLIAWKIWSIQRSVSGHAHGGVRMTRVISVIVESAAIYSMLLVVLIVTSVVGEAAMFIVLNSISPIIGIVFSYVIIRLSKDYIKTVRSATGTYKSASINFAPHHTAASLAQSYTVAAQGSTMSRPYSNNPTDSVQIKLETIVQSDAEMEMEKLESGGYDQRSSHSDVHKVDAI